MRKQRSKWWLVIVCLVVARALVAAPEPLDSWLDGIRKEHQLPALGAIVLRADSVVARGVAGVRRSDRATPVALGDCFQLGSNTKAMTATVIATLVEEGRLTWATTLADALPDLRDSMDPAFRAATIRHLHTSPVTPADKFALGWGVQDVDGAPSSVHSGSAGAFLALVILQPTRDLAVVVFTNDGGERATATTRDVAETLLHRFAAVEAK